MATFEVNGFVALPVDTPFDGHENLTPPGTCNTPGRQLVFRYVPPTSGMLAVHFQTAVAELVGSPVFILREVCDDPASQTMCLFDTGADIRFIPVEAGKALYFVVDSHQEKLPEFWIFIAVQVVPYRKAGEPCRGPNINPVFIRCEPGLICGTEDVCVVNTPPVLHDAVVYRGGLGGDELVVAVQAQDGTSDLAGIWARFYDAEGRELEGNPRPAFTVLGYLAGGSASLDDGRRTVDFFVTYPGLAEATEADVYVVDSGAVLSSPLRRPILPLPVAGEGEACDPEEMFTRCSAGMLCFEGLCEPVAPQRQAVCEEAPVIRFGEEMVFQENISVSGEPSVPNVWRLHESCLLRRRSDYYRLNPSTLVARLQLPTAASNVTISAQGLGASAPVVMLYAGCGVADPPLTCAAVPSGSSEAVLEFETLDAGDYLIVVKGDTVNNFVQWTLRVNGSF